MHVARAHARAIWAQAIAEYLDGSFNSGNGFPTLDLRSSPALEAPPHEGYYMFIHRLPTLEVDQAGVYPCFPDRLPGFCCILGMYSRHAAAVSGMFLRLNTI